MFIYGCDVFVGIWFEEFGCDNFFYCEYDVVFVLDVDWGVVVFDCFYGVFDLEVVVIGGEDGVGEIVVCFYWCLLLWEEVVLLVCYCCFLEGFVWVWVVVGKVGFVVVVRWGGLINYCECEFGLLLLL